MRYDHIIVDAGSAGSILANRLSEDPGRSVLLLEAGPDFPDIEQIPPELKYGYGVDRTVRARVIGPESPYDWSFTARATDENPEMYVPRGEVTGGLERVNAQIFLRGVPEDYDAWASDGNDKWSFQELLRFFRMIETDTDFQDDFHGTDGPTFVCRFRRNEWSADHEAFYDACRAAGYTDSPDHNEPDSTGVGPFPFNNPKGVMWSTAIAYLDEARHRLNLTVRPDCLVHKVLLHGGRARGVLAESGGQVFELAADEVILAAGAIGSPHLLMRSGIGPSGHLSAVGVKVAHDFPGVGKNLRDHPQATVAWRTSEGFNQDQRAPGIQVVLRYTAEGSPLRNDMLIHPASRVPGAPMFVPSSQPGISMVACLYLAESAGEVTLDSADPHVAPVLDYNLLDVPVDRERMREAMRICVELARHDAFAGIVETRLYPADAELESDDELDLWLLKSVKTSHHVSGTCKMGPDSDEMAVLDQHGRVYGVEGLRVADASIMPDCIRANTNATAMVIGERVAAFVREGL